MKDVFVFVVVEVEMCLESERGSSNWGIMFKDDPNEAPHPRNNSCPYIPTQRTMESPVLCGT